MWQNVDFKLEYLNSEFFFAYNGCHAKFKEPKLPYYLSIAGGRIMGFIHFPLCEIQRILSRYWTRIYKRKTYCDNIYFSRTLYFFFFNVWSACRSSIFLKSKVCWNKYQKKWAILKSFSFIWTYLLSILIYYYFPLSSISDFE